MTPHLDPYGFDHRRGPVLLVLGLLAGILALRILHVLPS